MLEFLLSLADGSGFMVHSHCMSRSPATVQLHFYGNILIGLAYYLIPMLLFYLKRQVKSSQNMNFYIGLFSLFIFSCGTGHLLTAYTLVSNPVYRLEGIWHILTAIVSWVALLAVWFGRRVIVDVGNAVFVCFQIIRQETDRNE